MKYPLRLALPLSCIAVVATAVATLTNGPAESAHAMKRLASRVYQLKDLAVEKHERGERREICDSPTATLERFRAHLSTLSPGQTIHEPHHHVHEEIFILKEGTAEVFVNGKWNRAEAGAFIFTASNDPHGVRNTSDAPATYYVLRWDSPGFEKSK